MPHAPAPCRLMHAATASTAFLVVPGFFTMSYTRFVRLKLFLMRTGSRMPSTVSMSRWHRGAAVAVSAMMGTSGNRVRRFTPRFE